MSDVLTVEVREKTGTAATRRLRAAGSVPAVLYGHGEDTVHLTVPRKDVDVMLRHHSKHVQLAGAVTQHAIVKDLQWDPLGIDVLHMDLFRVDLTEKVNVTLPIKLHGEPTGLNNHGVQNELLHEIEITCTAASMPDELLLNINDLDVGGSKTAADVVLPEGAELVTPADSVVVMMSAPSGGGGESENGEDAAAEPEVIGAKKEE